MVEIPELSVLDDLQQLAWLRQSRKPETNREVLSHLAETARCCLSAFEENQLVLAQTTLDDLLVETLIAMQTLEIRPSLAVKRAINRLEQPAGSRLFHVFTDRVEIRVNQEIRGQWPLFTMNDYQAALRLAHELGCDVIHEEAYQLKLFTAYTVIKDENACDTTLADKAEQTDCR
jgi:hypothetical protein